MSDQDLVQKRTPIGILAIVCLVGYVVLFFYPEYTGTQAAFLRVGLLLAALWLAMPTKTRSAAWKPLQSRWTLPGLIVFGLLLPRLKYMLPVLGVFLALAWFARPRKRR